MQVLCKVHARGESHVAWRTISVGEGQRDAGNPGVARPATTLALSEPLDPHCLDSDRATKLCGAPSAFHRAVLGMGTVLGMGLVLHSIGIRISDAELLNIGWMAMDQRDVRLSARGLVLLADQFQRRRSLTWRNESFRTPGDR